MNTSGAKIAAIASPAIEPLSSRRCQSRWNPGLVASVVLGGGGAGINESSQNTEASKAPDSASHRIGLLSVINPSPLLVIPSDIVCHENTELPACKAMLLGFPLGPTSRRLFF